MVINMYVRWLRGQCRFSCLTCLEAVKSSLSAYSTYRERLYLLCNRQSPRPHLYIFFSFFRFTLVEFLIGMKSPRRAIPAHGLPRFRLILSCRRLQSPHADATLKLADGAARLSQTCVVFTVLTGVRAFPVRRHDVDATRVDFSS